jgi:hypothetical protein
VCEPSAPGLLSEWSPVTSEILFRATTAWATSIPDEKGVVRVVGGRKSKSGGGFTFPSGYIHVFASTDECRVEHGRRVRPRSLVPYVTATHSMPPVLFYPATDSVGSRDVCAIDVSLRSDCIVHGVVIVTNGFGAELHACPSTNTALPEVITQCDYILSEEAWGCEDEATAPNDVMAPNPLRTLFLSGAKRFQCEAVANGAGGSWHGPLRVVIHVADAPALVRSVHVFTSAMPHTLPTGARNHHTTGVETGGLVLRAVTV